VEIWKCEKCGECENVMNMKMNFMNRATEYELSFRCVALLYCKILFSFYWSERWTT